jgi:hypothetical protein
MKDDASGDERAEPIVRAMREHPREFKEGQVFYHHPGETPTNLLESEGG